MRAYRLLLRLLPASFRGEYGGEMRAIFSRRRAETSGTLARLSLGIEAVADVVVTAFRAHLDLLRQDLRYAGRTLRRSPGFTTTAVVVAALGLGATTVAFSIADHVLLRPLPFPEPDRLVKLWQNQSFRGYSWFEVSPPNYRDWKRMATVFEGMAAYVPLSANLVGQGQPQRLEGASVTPDLFSVLRKQALLGRVLNEDDGRVGAAGTLVLSHSLWQGLFGGDPGVVGRTVVLDDAPCTIVGVMPPDFQFPSREAQLWKALQVNAPNLQERDDHYFKVVARLRPGVSVGQARAEMSTIAARLEREYPNENAHNGATIHRLRDEVPTQSRMLLFALVGAALCLLLIACTNLASLLLARGMARRRELAVRTALGAGRERLVRQLVTESLVLAAAGGALGVVLAVAGTPLVARLVPNMLPIAAEPGVDLRVLGFAAVLTLVTGIGFGVLPALRAFGDAQAAGLREGARAGVGGPKERLRSALVLAEVAVSVVLLVSSGLLLRALFRVQATDPGFRARGVLTLRTTLPLPRYEATARRHQFYERVLSEVRALPGVSSAAYISFLPMVMRGGIWPVVVPGFPEDPSKARMASLRYVTPGFFETLGIPRYEGRDVSDGDTQKTLPVAVVSQSFVDRYWSGEDPVGRRFRFAFFERTVVGVVGDIRVRGLERSSEPQVYLPDQQVPDGGIIGYTPKDLVVRARDAASLTPAIRRIVARADPEQPISDVQTLEDVVEADTAPRSVQVRVLGAFAVLAVLLAGIGLHGLLAYTVSSRAQEIGVRMALGAASPDVLRLVLGHGARLALGGVALGLALAYGAGRTLEALLAGVSPHDGTTFAVAVAVALLMTLLGSLLPALRALRVDPIAVMRVE
jgi:putative ABC transport system permease protein